MDGGDSGIFWNPSIHTTWVSLVDLLYALIESLNSSFSVSPEQNVLSDISKLWRMSRNTKLWSDCLYDAYSTFIFVPKALPPNCHLSSNQHPWNDKEKRVVEWGGRRCKCHYGVYSSHQGGSFVWHHFHVGRTVERTTLFGGYVQIGIVGRSQRDFYGVGEQYVDIHFLSFGKI
jgi:hypothetical protein